MTYSERERAKNGLGGGICSSGHSENLLTDWLIGSLKAYFDDT